MLETEPAPAASHHECNDNMHIGLFAIDIAGIFS